MDWWQPVSMIGTFIVGMTAVATLGWRVLERMRIENLAAHETIGRSIAKLRDDLTGDMAKLRDDMNKLREGMNGDMAKLRDDFTGDMAKLRADFTGDMASLRADLGKDITDLGDRLGGEIATGRAGLVGVREGIAELRGELKGVNRSLRALQEDFRAHVFRGSAHA